MKLTTITVRQGDWEAKYKLIRRNRIIDKKYARTLIPHMDVISELGSPIDLIQNGPGFYVIDGQHRIIAVSEFMETPVKFNAIIRDREEVTNEIAMLLGRHKSKAWFTKDSLWVTRDDSPWFRLANEIGFSAKFEVAPKKTWAWSSILTARIMADHIHANKSIAVGRGLGGTKDANLGLWLNSDKYVVDKTLRALQWWAPMAAQLQAKGVRTVFSHGMSALVISVYETNDANILAGVERGLLADEGMRALFSAMPLSQIAPILLRAMNYRRRERFVSLYEMTGREE